MSLRIALQNLFNVNFYFLLQLKEKFREMVCLFLCFGAVKNRSDLLFTNAAILSLELIYLTEIKTLIFDTDVKIQFREFLTLLLSPKKIVEKIWALKYSSGFFTKQIASQTGCHIKQVERK